MGYALVDLDSVPATLGDHDPARGRTGGAATLELQRGTRGGRRLWSYSGIGDDAREPS
jgi:hypothetical protein